MVYKEISKFVEYLNVITKIRYIAIKFLKRHFGNFLDPGRDFAVAGHWVSHWFFEENITTAKK